MGWLKQEGRGVGLALGGCIRDQFPRMRPWKRGILYAPDYAVNAGGVMNVALELDGYNRERAMRMMRTIYHNLSRIYEISDRDGIPTYRAADRLAEERIEKIGKLKLPLGRGRTRFQGRIRGH